MVTDRVDVALSGVVLITVTLPVEQVVDHAVHR
jgi:hypothetical protein